MGKQPYIPFYVGDYLKDTRILPLAVRGAWVDLILFMWDAPVRGEIIGTIQDFARLMSCNESEAKFALDLLKQKSTADFELLPDGQLKIISRKMKREAEISKKRSDAGLNGVKAKREREFAEAKAKAKREQNPEYEYDNEVELKLFKESVFEEIFTDERYLTDLSITHKGKDIKQAFEECWMHFSQQPNPPEHGWQWRQKLNTWLTNTKTDNGKGKSNSKDIGSAGSGSLVEGFKRRLSESANGKAV